MTWLDELRGRLSDNTKGDSAVSSVLAVIGIESQTGEEKILLMKRTMEVDTHRGQICFPGGYREPSDPNLLATALRETFEEIGVKSEELKILGRLSPVTTRNSVAILPWVAEMSLPYDFELNETEVEKLFYLPISELLERPLESVEFPVEGRTIMTHLLKWENEVIWGATARMLVELREHILATARNSSR